MIIHACFRFTISWLRSIESYSTGDKRKRQWIEIGRWHSINLHRWTNKEFLFSLFSQNLRSTDDDDVGRMQMVSRKVSAKKSHIDFRQFSSSPRILFPLAIQFKAAASSHTVPVAIPKWNDSDIIELNSNWTLFRPLVCLCEGKKDWKPF